MFCNIRLEVVCFLKEIAWYPMEQNYVHLDVNTSSGIRFQLTSLEKKRKVVTKREDSLLVKFLNSEKLKETKRNKKFLGYTLEQIIIFKFNENT